jgi:hypothetical protein
MLEKYYPQIDYNASSESAKLFPEDAPAPGARRYANEHDRMIDIVRGFAFTCNNRFLAQAYAGKTRSVVWSVGSAMHSSDSNAIFYSPPDSLKDRIFQSTEEKTYQSYQSLLTAQACNKNDKNLPATPSNITFSNMIDWPLSDASQENMQKVLNVTKSGIALGEDNLDLKSQCECWLKFQWEASKVTGDNIPGNAVGQC